MCETKKECKTHVCRAEEQSRVLHACKEQSAECRSCSSCRYLDGGGEGGKERRGKREEKKRVEEVRADSNGFFFLESPWAERIDHGRLFSVCFLSLRP